MRRDEALSLPHDTKLLVPLSSLALLLTQRRGSSYQLTFSGGFEKPVQAGLCHTVNLSQKAHCVMRLIPDFPNSAALPTDLDWQGLIADR
jgi:hypothetical protein